ncbi:MAG: CPBP family intramembrane metalloprotease [Proteobacteria bacterium]|nr:CPBP family intramembrane metalloprotease [Pseudomonadota bacterium]
MQQFNSTNVVFKSTRHACVGLVCAIGIALLYKLNNFSISSLLNFDFGSQYLNYEFDRTLLRFLNSLLAVGVFFIVTRDSKRSLWSSNKQILWILVLYMLIFGMLKIVFLGVPEFLSTMDFMFELYFNFFTGISEEFIFRGLLFGGLCWFFSPLKSIFFSSALFSLFHLRPSANISDYIFWFVAGLSLCAFFARGGGLVILCVFHFLWDQLHYGLRWPDANGFSYITALILLDVLFFLWVYYRYKPPSYCENHLRQGL